MQPLRTAPPGREELEGRPLHRLARKILPDAGQPTALSEAPPREKRAARATQLSRTRPPPSEFPLGEFLIQFQLTIVAIQEKRGHPMRPVRRMWFAAGVAVVLCAATGDRTSATILLKQDVESLRRLSESVVHARVVEIESAWNPQKSMIFTDVTLEVIETLYGVPRKHVVVRVPGGTVDGFTLEMSEAPVFRLDEEVVVFLSRWRDGRPMVAGYSQGLAEVVAGGPKGLTLKGGVIHGLEMSELARRLNPSSTPGRRTP